MQTKESINSVPFFVQSGCKLQVVFGCESDIEALGLVITRVSIGMLGGISDKKRFAIAIQGY